MGTLKPHPAHARMLALSGEPRARALVHADAPQSADHVHQLEFVKRRRRDDDVLHRALDARQEQAACTLPLLATLRVRDLLRLRRDDRRAGVNGHL